MTNAGASYQRLMDVCLSGLPSNRILAYMDDIVIFSRIDAHFDKQTMHSLTSKYNEVIHVYDIYGNLSNKRGFIILVKQTYGHTKMCSKSKFVTPSDSKAQQQAFCNQLENDKKRRNRAATIPSEPHIRPGPYNG